MIRPEGHVTIGADASGASNFMGYISSMFFIPKSITTKEVENLYQAGNLFNVPSLGDGDFEEIDPDSKFILSPDMKPVYEKKETFTLSAQTGDFNEDPLVHGGEAYKELIGDFVVIATMEDMEGLEQHNVKGYNEGGILIADGNTYYQLGVFPLYNCGNMLTVLNDHSRPQFPNYKGYDFDSLMQFERRGNLLFARTSKDGNTWNNMPGSPIEVSSPTLKVGAYQTTYNDTPSWVKIHDYTIFQKK